jgi:predicted nucleic acid-binding protein
MFLLDTCVVSESTQAQPNAAVIAWLAEQALELQFMSAVTFGELHFGVARLPMSKRRENLAHWLGTVEQTFEGKILPFDDVVGRRWGLLRAEKPSAEVADSQIAATALVHGLTVVTRNDRDFAFEGLSVFNPWRS